MIPDVVESTDGMSHCKRDANLAAGESPSRELLLRQELIQLGGRDGLFEIAERSVLLGLGRRLDQASCGGAVKG